MRRPTAILLRRVAAAVAVLVLVAVVFVLVAPSLVSIEVVRRSMSREIAGWSGRSLTFEGTPEVAFTPYLTVTFPNVKIGSNRNETTLVEMESLRAQVPILPLIFRGRIEPSSFTFRRPRFHFVVDAAGVPNWDLPNGLDATSPVRKLVMTDGSIDYADGEGRSLSIEKIDAVLEMPDPHGAANIQGRADWRGESATFYGSVNSPAALLDGDKADIRVALESPPLRGSFDGSLRRLDGLAVSGQLSLSTPSLTHLAELLSVPTERLPRLASASISSSADLAGGRLTLGDAALTLDGNQGVGAITLALGGARPSVQATLAFDLLDVTSYAGAARAILATSRLAPDAPLGWPKLDRLDADLRLSADRLRIGDETAGRMAASLALRDGRLDVAIGDLQLYGGRLTASLTAEMEGDVPSGSLQARIDALPLKAALSDLAGIEALEGTASGTLSLQGGGANWNALVASLDGRGNATISDGSLTGISLAVLTGSKAAPSTLENRLFNGSTAFKSAKGTLLIAGGTISAPDVTVTGSGYSLEMAAAAALGLPDIRAHGSALLGGQRSPPETVPFDIGGTWARPELTIGAPPPAP